MGFLSFPIFIFWYFNSFVALYILFLAVPAALLSGITLEYALRYLILEDKSAIKSLKNSLSLVRRKKKETLLIWLITVGLRLVGGIVLVLALIFVVFVLFLFGLIFYLLAPLASIVYIIFAMIALIILCFLASGFINALLSAYWTLAFKEINL